MLGGAGRVSHDRMEGLALERYEAFEAGRREREAIKAAAEEVEELRRIQSDAQRKLGEDRK